MSAAADTSSRQYLLECEARQWLREGYTSRVMVADLIDRIEKKRGMAAALELRQEMLRQWARRVEWQGEPT